MSPFQCEKPCREAQAFLWNKNTSCYPLFDLSFGKTSDGVATNNFAHWMTNKTVLAIQLLKTSGSALKNLTSIGFPKNQNKLYVRPFMLYRLKSSK
ncbi:hypothetical protein NC99_31770 [Sunxiuqinia dokdonensis]|uniref:Uncharacterized protein n=1 Tax=Sunxiuqinia dokdonensis TaxID=1409788 RepID=A0A0L8V693_9BACT|nr:hypothetical protein NC99_31770 [Sunxiuqinia dokdonensis]